MTTLERVVADVRDASRVLARMPGHHRDAALREMADALERRSAEILRENRLDVEAAKRGRTAPALIDRLLLDEDRVADMAAGLRAVAALPDPVGVVDGGRRLPNGLELERRRVPLGVVAVVYEGRPNVTADAVGLCLKSGNAVVLRGSRLATRSNLIIAEVLTGALIEADAPRWAVALLGPDREELARLVQMEGLVDLVIPRGGEELKAFLRDTARVPVIYAASGNNHVYVHADADPEMAARIVVNAKVQRPGVCNAAETLLVHRDAAAEVLPLAAGRLVQAGVELRVDRAGLDLLGDAAEGMAEATEADYETEFLDLVMAVRVVGSLQEAVEHIGRHGSGHSEAIVTTSIDAARDFQESVDAAVVYVNASTRFTDGGEFGMGAEIGISTQKLHARGPIGLQELTTYTYLVTGHGHLR
ncbi:MAG: glutamate-5-semialdehyde dehydrogenase [Thermoleophilia bacterium]